VFAAARPVNNPLDIAIPNPDMAGYKAAGTGMKSFKDFRWVPTVLSNRRLTKTP